MIVFVGQLITAPACSDNVDDRLVAISEKRDLGVYINGENDLELNLSGDASSTLVDVYSNLKWDVKVKDCEGGWCSVDVTNSRGTGTFKINVSENGLQWRSCYVAVSSNDFNNGEPFEIYVFQYAVSEEVARPVVSIPKLIGEPGQISASIQFEYVSKYYTVVGYGIEYSKENGEAWKKVSGSSDNGKVSVELTGLSEGTTYKVRGFIEYEANNIRIEYSSDNLIFTTNGETPGGGDNPTPPIPE